MSARTRGRRVGGGTPAPRISQFSSTPSSALAPPALASPALAPVITPPIITPPAIVPKERIIRRGPQATVSARISTGAIPASAIPASAIPASATQSPSLSLPPTAEVISPIPSLAPSPRPTPSPRPVPFPSGPAPKISIPSPRPALPARIPSTKVTSTRIPSAKVPTPSGIFDRLEWVDRLQILLNKILAPIEPNESKRNRYLTSEAMNIWVKAFTHGSVDYENNYEVLETLGDRVLDLYFLEYAQVKLPDLDSDGYSDVIHRYQKADHQGMMSDKYGFYDILAIKERAEKETKVRGDVFESFYGGLFTVGNMVFPGLGGVLVHNMVKDMYDQENIEEGRKDAKSDLMATFNKFSDSGVAKQDYFDLIKYASRPLRDRKGGDVRDEHGNYTYIVRLPPNVVQFLREEGFDPDPRKKFTDGEGYVVIGEGQDVDKKKAGMKAYENARDILDNLGFTLIKATEIKQEDVFSTLDQQLVQAAKEKAKREGITLVIGTPKKLQLAVLLEGMKPNGRSVTLVVYQYEFRDNIIDVRNRVLEIYLAKK